jgi:hypothetical protein
MECSASLRTRSRFASHPRRGSPANYPGKDESPSSKGPLHGTFAPRTRGILCRILRSYGKNAPLVPPFSPFQAPSNSAASPKTLIRQSSLKAKPSDFCFGLEPTFIRHSLVGICPIRKYRSPCPSSPAAPASSISSLSCCLQPTPATCPLRSYISHQCTEPVQFPSVHHASTFESRVHAPSSLHPPEG